MGAWHGDTAANHTRSNLGTSFPLFHGSYPLLSSPVRLPPVSQSTAHIYANPPFSNFHHQLGVLLVAGWAGLVWLVPLIINLEIKTKARLAAAAVSGPTPAPAPTLGEYTI